jgi:xanthosine utilization system XapX-like protein
MSKPARSLFVFGIYLFFVAATFIFAPNVLMALIGAPQPDPAWIRVSGMLAGFIGYYYVQVARQELAVFFPWSIHVRLSVIVILGAFALAGVLAPVLVLFGVVDFAGAIWTWRALRGSKTEVIR